MQKAYALVIALAAGGLVGLLRSYGTLVEQLRRTAAGRRCGWRSCSGVLFIPEALNVPQWLNPIPRGQMAGLAFEPSVLLIGAGMITGLRVSLSMLLGSVLLYFVVAPRVLVMDLTHAGVAGYVPSFTLKPNGEFQSHPLGVVGRDLDHGLLEPGDRGPAMADPRARLHAVQEDRSPRPQRRYGRH